MSARVAAFGIALGALLLLYGAAFFDPPYWDALLGAFPQGLWLARNGFDGVRLLTEEASYIDGGPSVYPFSVYPYAIGALYALDLSPRAVFGVMHAVSFVSAAAVLASLVRIVADHVPRADGAANPPLGVRLACVLAVFPLFGSMTSQINMDMPLAACTLLASEALLARRYARAFGWNTLALLVKPNGIVAVVAAAITLALVRDRKARPWTCAHGGLVLVFGLQVWLLQSFDRAPPYVSVLGGLVQLFRSRLWMIPEYGLAFVAFLVWLPFALRRALSRSADPLERLVTVFLTTFVAFYFQVGNPLPRYFLQSLPYFLLCVALLARRWRIPRAAGNVAFAGALLVCVVNRHGILYPPSRSDWDVQELRRTGAANVAQRLARNDGFLLERSLEYQDDLELSRALARDLDALPRDSTVLVANWPLAHLLAFPEFGYVDSGFRVCAPDQPLAYDPRGVRFTDLYAKSAGEWKRKVSDDVVWVVAPNVFSSGATRVLVGDLVLHVAEHGDHKAFVLRRKDWE
ncbi:MAG: hypothetical protein ACKVWV_08710 [Planctomycetota bacterium]